MAAAWSSAKVRPSQREGGRCGRARIGPPLLRRRGDCALTDPNADPSDPDPDVYFAEVPEQTGAFVHLPLRRVRRSQLPSLHDLSDGSTNPIGLASTQGIAEASDLVLFRQSCVVGWLINRAGPSQGNVLRYLEERTAVSMRLPVLHREDALDLVRGDLVKARSSASTATTAIAKRCLDAALLAPVLAFVSV